jgi:hypothetical protein
MIAAPLKLPAAPNARSGGIDSGNVEPLHRAVRPEQAGARRR